jgi:hypothetical protein
MNELIGRSVRNLVPLLDGHAMVVPTGAIGTIVKFVMVHDDRTDSGSERPEFLVEFALGSFWREDDAIEPTEL